ncbi:hypothetical protein PMAYCL1PPCAC_05530 [Pristionchus mayeri]|uniref:Uncharacterized protein n=1 Tax=Pristionchus mayeri TaxID=1317129 RepID=A0AAN4ZCS8_9BILA|nr:hypothetical protein PMAYCL1PPCAC_05530 [Pristionchus mayeri]
MRGMPSLSARSFLWSSSSFLTASGSAPLILSICTFIAVGSVMSLRKRSFIWRAGAWAAALSLPMSSSAMAGFALSASRIFFARSMISGGTAITVVDYCSEDRYGNERKEEFTQDREEKRDESARMNWLVLDMRRTEGFLGRRRVVREGQKLVR